MSKIKHALPWILLGWALAYLFPPQRALGFLGRKPSSGN